MLLSQILYLWCSQFFETRNGVLNLISRFWFIYLICCHHFESCFFFPLYYLLGLHYLQVWWVYIYLSSSESQMKTMEKKVWRQSCGIRMDILSSWHQTINKHPMRWGYICLGLPPCLPYTSAFSKNSVCRCYLKVRGKVITHYLRVSWECVEILFQVMDPDICSSATISLSWTQSVD